MGLDMYMRKRIDGDKEDSVEVAYWRKCNQIHAWMEERVADGFAENCEEYEVSVDDVRALVDTCKKVLDDHSLAPILLPCKDGFYFGSQAYDADYFMDLEDTVEMLEKMLPGVGEHDELWYHAWW